jgi:hypothetical protein
MTASSPEPDPRLILVADVIFKALVASTRAQEVSRKFYRRGTGIQKDTEDEFRRVSLAAARDFIKKLDELARSTGAPLTKEGRAELMRASLAEVQRQYGNA